MATSKTKYFLAIILSIIISSASTYFFLDSNIKYTERNNLENNLSRIIEMQKQGQVKFIDFSILATFSWDELYILGPYVILEKVPLENHWPNSFPTFIESSDDFVLLVFSNKGKAVQYLEYRRDTCDFSPASNIHSYNRYNALFTVDDKNRCIPID